MLFVRAALVALAAALAVLVLASQSLSSSACQPPFTNFSGHCAYINEAERLTWCDAAARCLQIGGELIIDMGIVRAVRSGLSGSVWIGVTDLLNERGNSLTGWQLTNGSLIDLSSSGWNSTNPMNHANDDDFIGVSAAGFGDVVVSYKKSLACQPITTPNSTLFTVTNFLKLGNISPTYCFTEKTGMYQKLDCLSLCSIRWQCRAALHNSNNGVCRMIDFTDATVEPEIENDPNFKKYVKVY